MTDPETTRAGRLSRRAVVKGSAGAAMAGAALVAVGGGTAKAADGPPMTATALEDRPVTIQENQSDVMVVHVRDARVGLLDVFIGERHIELRDLKLTGRLMAIGR